MKKVLLSLLAIVILVSIFGFVRSNEKLPVGSEPAKADSLANEMLKAVNDAAWKATGAAKWNFMGRHEHIWDKNRNLALVKWKKFEVYVDNNQRKGIAFKNGEQITGEKADKLVQKAWEFWINDSFWLNPVSKAFDEGTTRTLVTTKRGHKGLMVSYSSGGSTPGDSYVWLLDENNLPYAWKMWVSIIPIGGIKVPWNGWITTETGAKICNLHDTKIIDLKLKDVHTAKDIIALEGADIFEPLIQSLGLN